MSHADYAIQIHQECQTTAFKLLARLARITEKTTLLIQDLSLTVTLKSQQGVLTQSEKIDLERRQASHLAIASFLAQLVDENADLAMTARKIYDYIIAKQAQNEWHHYPAKEKQALLKLLFHLDNIVVFDGYYQKVRCQGVEYATIQSLNTQLKCLFHYGNEAPELRQKLGESSNKILFEFISRIEALEQVYVETTASGRSKAAIKKEEQHHKTRSMSPFTVQDRKLIALSPAWLMAIVGEDSLSQHAYFTTYPSRTSVGEKRLQQLLKQVVTKETETLSSRDLALLASFFGSDLFQRGMSRYDIDADGKKDKPINTRTIRMILVAIASIYTHDDIREASPTMVKWLQGFARYIGKMQGFDDPKEIDAIKKSLENGTQNPAPQSGLNQYTYLLRTKGKQLKNKIVYWIADKLTKWINVIDSSFVDNIISMVFIKLFLDNQYLYRFEQDIDFLSVEYQNQRYLKNTHHTEVPLFAKPIFDYLGHHTFREFTKQYPEFDIAYLTEAQKKALAHYHRIVRTEEPMLIAKAQCELVPLIIEKCDPNYFLKKPILDDLETLSKQSFLEKYPGLSKQSLLQQQYLLLEQYYQARQTQNVTALAMMKQSVSDLLDERLNDISQFARLESIGHLLNYADQHSRDGHVVILPDQNNIGQQYEMFSIIPDEGGLSMALYKPIDLPFMYANEPIPLIINFTGTHDVASALRDLDPNGPGHEAYDPKGVYLSKMLRAINEHIANLKTQYPGRKVRLELFGHSLGGADVYLFESALLDAMAQNKMTTKSGQQDYQALLRENNQNGFHHALNPKLSKHLPQALKEVVGEEKRVLDAGIIEDRLLPKEIINHITLNNIDSIVSNSANSAGIHKKVSYGMHAAAAFLMKGSDFHLNDNVLLVEGDLVLQTGHTRGFAYADPKEAFFKQAIQVRTATLSAGFETAKKILSQALGGDLSPILAHTCRFFQQPEKWFKVAAILHDNFLPGDFDTVNKMLNRKLSVNDTPFVEMGAYVSIKNSLYSSTQFAYHIAQPIFHWWQHFAFMLFDLVDQLSVYLVGHQSSKMLMPDRNRNEEWIAQQFAQKSHEILFEGYKNKGNNTLKELCACTPPTTEQTIPGKTMQDSCNQSLSQNTTKLSLIKK